jgi:hypothetical protein
MLSSGMLCRVARVRTDISEKHNLLVTANIVPSSLSLFTLTMEALNSSETSVLTRVTWHNIPEDDFLHESFHGSDYEECHPVGCDAMWLL